MFIIWGCDKENPNDSSFTNPALVWKANKGIERYDQISQDPVIYKDRLVIGYQTERDEGYVIYNKNNGNRVKEIANSPSFDVFSQLHQGIYYSTFGPRFRTIDLNSFEQKWYTIKSDGSPYITMVFDDEKIIVPSWSRVGETELASNMFKFVSAKLNNLSTWSDFIVGELEKKSDAFGSAVKSFIKNKNDKGHDIYYFISSHGFNDPNKRGDFQVHSYNKTLEKYEWHSEIMEEDPRAGLTGKPPHIFKSTIITNSGASINCRDINSGTLIWRTYIESGITGNTINLFNGKLVSIDQFGMLFQVDASSGQILKKLDIGASGTKNWAFHNGIIYFTTAGSKLYAIDAEPLTVKWELMSPNRDRCSYCTFGFESPVVDPETNRLYISDAWEVFCYELPK